MPGEPDLYDAIKSVVDGTLAGMHICLPGRIEKYDYTNSKADVKPLLKRKLLDGTVEELAIIPNVPVAWPRTSDFVLSAPMSQGDQVLLVFVERSMDEWLSEGGEPTPVDKRKFDMSDAVAIPGLYSFKQMSPVDSADEVQLRYKEARIRIKPDGEIVMNGSKFTLGEITKTLVNDSFSTIFDAHVHPIGTPNTGVPVTPMIPANFTTKTEAE